MLFRIINYRSTKKLFLFIVRAPLFNHNGKLNFRNGRPEQNALHEELLKGMELSEIEKKEMLKRLEKNTSNETNKQRLGTEGDLELVPLNSPTSLSNTTPDILIDPNRAEEKTKNGTPKKRTLGARLTLTLSKKKSDEGEEKTNVKLDEETKQVR